MNKQTNLISCKLIPYQKAELCADKSLQVLHHKSIVLCHSLDLTAVLAWMLSVLEKQCLSGVMELFCSIDEI